MTALELLRFCVERNGIKRKSQIQLDAEPLKLNRSRNREMNAGVDKTDIQSLIIGVLATPQSHERNQRSQLSEIVVGVLAFSFRKEKKRRFSALALLLRFTATQTNLFA